MKELSKALIVCLPFLLVFLLMPNFIGNSPDYSAHYEMAKENYLGERFTQPAYAPLLATLLGIFTVKIEYFNFAAMFLIIIITPLLLVYITKNWLAALFYFTTSTYFYFTSAGLLSQALLGIFILLLFCSKNIYLRLGFVLLGGISHSYGVYAMLGALLIILLKENGFHKFYLAGFCSPVWGNKISPLLTQKVNPVLSGVEGIAINDILSFFTKIAPFPFLFIAIKTFLEEKDYDYLLLIGVCFVAAYFVNARILYMIGLFSIIGFTKGFHKLVAKKFWVGLALVNGALLLVQHYLLVNKVFC